MKAKLAMKIGGMYRLHNIGISQWKRLAAELRLDVDSLISRIAGFADSLPTLARELCERVAAEGLSHPLIARLAKALEIRAAQCRKRLG